MDFIQEKLFINNKNVLKRKSKVIYYNCTNCFFKIDNQEYFRKYGIFKEHRSSSRVGMCLFMGGDGLPLSFNIYYGNKMNKLL